MGVGDDLGLPGRSIEGGLGFRVPEFAAAPPPAASEAGSGVRLSGIGGRASLRDFGEEDGDREEGGTRWFPLGYV